jgi:hypothetical protein
MSNWTAWALAVATPLIALCSSLIIHQVSFLFSMRYTIIYFRIFIELLSMRWPCALPIVVLFIEKYEQYYPIDIRIELIYRSFDYRVIR